jgi:hypothetical protein
MVKYARRIGMVRDMSGNMVMVITHKEKINRDDIFMDLARVHVIDILVDLHCFFFTREREGKGCKGMSIDWSWEVDLAEVIAVYCYTFSYC